MIQLSTVSSTVQFKQIKLEKGNKATSWSPAPEDIDASISTAQSTAISTAASNAAALYVTQTAYSSQVKIFKDSINAKVSQTDFNTLGQTVGQHTTAIQQNAQDITSKVSSTDYTGNNIASLINQTATTIAIQANKINLVGAVTISAIDKSSVTPSALGAATPTDVTTAVDNIQIGGRNLFISGSYNTKMVTISGSGDGSNELINQTDIHAYLKAGVQYIFSCDTDGVYGGSGDTVEVFLLKDNTYNTYYRMGSNVQIFTPSVSGTYYLRLDINQNNKTHWFSDIQIEEGLEKLVEKDTDASNTTKTENS